MARRSGRRYAHGRGIPPRSVLRQAAFVLASAAVLFGVGIAFGAWIARPSTEPQRAAVTSPPVASPSLSAPPLAPPPASPRPAIAAGPARMPTETAAAVPLPRLPTAEAERAPAAPALVPESKPGPVVVPPTEDMPAWRRHAAVAEAAEGRPMIAIVLDDLGIDKRRAGRAIGLPAPVTLAFLTYATDLEEQTALARQRGHELLVHVPMQPHGHNSDPGPNVLDMDLGAAEVRRRIAWSLQQFDGYVGINNHMGSRFTESEEGMRLVAEAMRDRGLLFLDSLTSAKSVGEATARSLGVPTTRRDVFLDNTDTAAEVELRLAQAERVARETGSAIAIGHPRDATLNVLEQWIPKARGAGFVLVPLTAVVEARAGGGIRQAKR